jgi:RES domain-containing protein
VTVAVWRIGTDTPDYTADDMKGEGAKRTGGRWNRAGAPVVYTATNIALACLETVVHWNAGDLPLNRYLVRIDVPDEVWTKSIAINKEDGPIGWDAVPTGKVSLDVGDKWLSGKKSALLLVPSVIVPEEMNALINPLHPDAAQITATKVRRWLYDARIRV